MKYISGYKELYSANKIGKIWSHRRNRFLKTWLIGHGYEMVMLYKDKMPRKFLVHRLIAQTFILNPMNLKEVNHINAKRLDNRIENLEWVSSKENKQHAIKLGLYKNLGKNPLRGTKNPGAKLNDNLVIFIRNSDVSNGKLAKEIGVSKHLISLVKRRITWKHVI